MTAPPPLRPRLDVATVLGRLRALVEGDGPMPGTRLPDERRLAATLGCSRQTLRGALAQLEAEGRIWRHVGQGTFVGPRPPGQPLRDTLLLQAVSPAQLMQARRMIEPPVAAEAARHATAADLAHLRGLIARGRRAASRNACEQADAAFHRALAETARNPVLIGVLDHLAGARRRAAWQHQWERTYRRIGAAEFTGPHSDQHAAIVDALAARDPASAAAVMARHLDTIALAMTPPAPPRPEPP